MTQVSTTRSSLDVRAERVAALAHLGTDEHAKERVLLQATEEESQERAVAGVGLDHHRHDLSRNGMDRLPRGGPST